MLPRKQNKQQPNQKPKTKKQKTYSQDSEEKPNTAKIFSHSVGFLSLHLTISIAVQDTFNFIRSHLPAVDISCWAIGVLFIGFAYTYL